MDGQLHTPQRPQAFSRCASHGSKSKAAARLIPCTFIGKHLRFSDDDIAAIMKAGARQPVTSRERGPGRRTA